MRSKWLIVSLLLLPGIALCQPPKKNIKATSDVNREIVVDTLTTKTDTTKYCFAVWMGGDESTGEGYLSRLNGYLVRTYKVGKFIAQEPTFKYYDWKWKELRPEQLEASLSKQVKWKE